MLPYFVADQAKVTVLRPLASSAFGKYSLTLPEDVGVEDVHKLSAPGNELGFVAALSRRRVGGMARRFVRADVSIKAVDVRSEDWIPSSDVHSVLSEAKGRVSADFFLESDISLAGLGEWRPFVDFQLGDKARVDIFGMVVVMAVTRIEPKISDHSEDDWLVHVGAQLVSDDQARLAANEVLRRAVVENLKELAGVSAQASRAVSAAAEASSVAAGAQSTADVAQSTAARADEKADRAVAVAESQGELAREAMQVAASSSAEAREATSRAMSADLVSEEGKRIAIAANTTANQAQQTAIEANTRTNQIQQTAIEANERSIKAVGEVAEANAKANDAQQRAIDLGFLFNHGEWAMSKEWKANAGETKVMDFDTELSTPRGCESTVITTNGEPVGHGIKFLSPGFWRLYARVLVPWVGIVQSSGVRVNIVVMGKNGKSIAESKYTMVVDTAPVTASFPMTVEIPESGCYAYVSVRTSQALNQSIVPGKFVEPGNNEFSAQQISKIF